MMNSKTDSNEHQVNDSLYLLNLYKELYLARITEEVNKQRIRFPGELSEDDLNNSSDADKPEKRISQSIRNEIDTIWMCESASFIKEFAAKYDLDRSDIEILAFIISNQSISRIRTMNGSDILEMISLDGNTLSLFHKLMPESNLRKYKLIYYYGTPWESILGVEWRVTDKVIMEMVARQHYEDTPDNATTPGKNEPFGLAEIIQPTIGLDSVVISDNKRNQIESLLAQHRCGMTIFEDWGLGNQVKYGKAATTLLYGPSGTGKTLLAKAIAYEAKTELLIARYSRLEASLVGETEKNIARLFQYAKSTQRALLIDECDAILCRRLEGNRSNDRFFNQQLLVFCQEIENFDGILILTTNRADALDEALDRRIALKLEMPMPSSSERENIWQLHLTEKMPLSKDINLEYLARKFNITGGQIKNAVISAARNAITKAENLGISPLICMADLEIAAKIEFETFRQNKSGLTIGFRAPDYKSKCSES